MPEYITDNTEISSDEENSDGEYSDEDKSAEDTTKTKNSRI